MLTDTSNRSRYLLLALDARKVIDALVGFVDTGRRGSDLDKILKNAMESLKSVGRGGNVFEASRNRLAFGHYEQVRTVEEVRGVDDREGVIAGLSAVLDQSGPPEKQQQLALEALEFFHALEGRALQHYSHPPAPKKVLRPNGD